ncbi:MAG: amidohydrolase [Verrucomicrobiae bacterium]|nr:amidohydrolase [Verrucomicrobiae bacterium]
MRNSAPLAVSLTVASCAIAQDAVLQQLVRERVAAAYPSLFDLYRHFHANPELSGHEIKTAARLAAELRDAGYDVTTGVGGHGVVAVLTNGAGPTVLIRADMDALPVREQTGLPYASTVVTKDDAGREVPVMHACGHDFHMTALVGTARVLAQLRERWRGTLVLIGQPAEETGQGARAMLRDGLFTRFPRPDFCLALHDKADLPAGDVACVPGPAYANVDSLDVIVRGVGGHGAWPHTTKDPIVLASQIVLALQTIVSRETEPGQPAVVTVGAIHGGTKRNVIPDEVTLQLTIRTYSEEVRQRTLESIRRIVRGQALAAGLPEERLPILQQPEDSFAVLTNHVALTQRLMTVFKAWFGEQHVHQAKPTMGGEDFSEYGRTPEQIPICIFWVGAVNREKFEQARRTGKPLPSLHSPFWAPDPEPTIKTGVTAMCAAALDLLAPR